MNAQDATRALDTMNYHAAPLTKNRPIRLMWKHRDPSMRKIGQGNVFVKNLDKAIDNKALHDTFSQFGSIMSCKVATDDKGQSLGYGFVHFETPEAAREAQEKVNGMLIAGRKVYVGPFLNRREREAAGQVHKSFTNIYVKNLDESVCSEDKVHELFGAYGHITSLFIPKDHEGKVKGFAFINFENPDLARKAVDDMNGKEIEGKVLFVGRAQKKSEREAELKNKYEALKMERMRKYQGVNLYVKNLSDDVDDDKIREEFATFGTITSCKIMRDDKGNSRGFGFVCFSHPDEATKAVTELNGRMVGQKPIYVAIAQRKEVRRAQLEAMRQVGIRGMAGTGIPGGPGIYAQGAPFVYGQPSGMPQMAPGMSAGGRGGPQPGFINPQYPVAGGRGQPMGRGAPINPQYLGVGRGGGPGMGGPGMMPFGAMQGRQPRQNRRGGGPGGMPGGPAGVQGGPGGMVPNRGIAGRGRGMPTGNGPAGQPFNKFGMGPRNPGQGPGNPGQTGGPLSSQMGPNGTSQGQDPRSSTANQPLTIESLAKASSQDQKIMLGEKLYPLIEERQQGLGSKLTGMLLEMDNADILHLIESPEALAEQIDEALAVLRKHAADGPKS